MMRLERGKRWRHENKKRVGVKEEEIRILDGLLEEFNQKRVERYRKLANGMGQMRVF